MRSLRAIVCAAAVLAAAAAAAQPRRVTVVTISGEVIEGTLKTISDTEVVVDIADQPITLPLENIRYLSFVGRLPEASAVDAAIRALKDVRGVVEIGRITREQYAQKLGEILPRVFEFVREPNPAGWADVRVAMLRAVENYQQPLANDNAWQNAADSLRRAVAYGDYAVATAALPGEALHAELPETRTIALGDSVTGRLGRGDWTMPEDIDRSAADGFHDLLTIAVTASTRIELQMSCAPCQPHLAIMDETGKRLEADLGLTESARIRRTIAPGTYTIWAGTLTGQVGTYTLDVRAQ